MKDNKLIFENWFWKAMEFFKEQHKELPLDLVLKKLEITPAQFFKFTLFCDSVGAKFEISEVNGEKYLKPPRLEKILPVTMVEWLAHQLENLSTKPDSIFFEGTLPPKCEEILNRMKDRFAQYSLEDLFSGSPTSATFSKTELDAAIENSFVIQLHTESKTERAFFPHRLVYLDGELTLIGEDVPSGRLESIALSEVVSFTVCCEKSFETRYGTREIEDYIMATRAVLGEEVRLVMKIFCGSPVDLTPPYHFFSRPFLTPNSNGDMIWGASVEPSKALYEWLWEVKEYIEIIDPSSLKENFFEYCEDRCDHELSKLRKVS